MKVGLFYLRSNKIQSTAAMPLGIAYLGAMLEKEGFDVKLFDTLYESENELLKKICFFYPDIMGFSFLSSEYKETKYWVSILRQYMPKTIFVGGGIHISSILGEPSVADIGLDYGICGEAEHLFVQFCKRQLLNQDVSDMKGLIWRSSLQVVRNEPSTDFCSLDDLPFPARHLLDMDKYLMPPGRIKSFICNGTMTVMTTRGCPGRCVYCDANLLFGTKIRTRSVENVMKEIEEVSQKYNFEGILFFDDTFTLRKEWIYNFCKEMRKTKIIWGCNSRTDFIDLDILRQMKDAGCVQIAFGVESGSPEVLKFMKKPIPPSKTIAVFDSCKKLGIRTYANFMVGFPNETLEDIEKSISLIKRIKPDFCTTSIVTPFPGTELFRYGIANGLIDKNRIENLEFNMFGESNTHISRKFCHKELVYLKNRVQNVNFYRNYVKVFFVKRNLKYIFLSLYVTIIHPLKLLKSIKRFLEKKDFDIIVMHCYRQLHEFILCRKGVHGRALPR